MAEILSRDEINALLAVISDEAKDEAKDEGEPAPKERPARPDAQGRVRPYDFARPNKLSKDQLRTLQLMHESFARGIATSLSGYLRTFVEAEVVSTDAMLYEEFSRNVPNPGIMAIFALPPLEGSVMLEIGPDIGIAIIDRLLGGPGTLPKRARELTELEQPVMRRIVDRVMSNLNEAWRHVVEVEPRFDQLELNPQFTQLAPPKDIVIVIGIELTLRGGRGRMNLCIPYDAIEPVVPKLSAHYLFARSRKEAASEQSEAIVENLRLMPVPIRVILGRSAVTVRELVDLEVGDYISLETKRDALLTVLVGARAKFMGRPGRVGTRLAVELIRQADEGE